MTDVLRLNSSVQWHSTSYHVQYAYVSMDELSAMRRFQDSVRHASERLDSDLAHGQQQGHGVYLCSVSGAEL